MRLCRSVRSCRDGGFVTRVQGPRGDRPTVMAPRYACYYARPMSDATDDDDLGAPSLEPTDAIACAVGRFLLAASAFEGALGSALWRVVGKRSGVLVAGLSVGDLKQTLRTLTRMHAESHLDNLKALLAEAASLNEDRNNVILGYWFFNIRLADREGRSDVAFRPDAGSPTLRASSTPSAICTT